MREIKAIVYGVGTMGAVATRLMLEKGVVVVGALARSDQKVGRDLGEVAGLGLTTNVEVERDARQVLSTRSADIAVVAVATFIDDMYEHLSLCAEHGVNAVTLSEESLYPWNSSPAQSAELDRLAKRSGVTITGTGHQDAYWVNMVSLLMGTAHRIDSVRGEVSFNVDDYGPEVAREFGVGMTTEEYHDHLAQYGSAPSFGVNALGALAADAGLVTRSMDTRREPLVAERDTRCKSLDTTVPPGKVIGTRETVTLAAREGPALEYVQLSKLYDKGEADRNEWMVRGEPEELRLSNSPVPTSMTTCTQLVNRIPDVINAEPGFVTIEKLPKLRYRAFALDHYVARPSVDFWHRVS